MSTFAKENLLPIATKIWLEDVPRLEHNKSQIPAKDLNRIMQWLAANKNFVVDKWNEHFK